MSREGDEPDNSPPRSMADPEEFRSRTTSAGARSPPMFSPTPRSDVLSKSPRIIQNGNHALRMHDDDTDSNVQDGVRSEAGETILPIVRNVPATAPSVFLISVAEGTWSS